MAKTENTEGKKTRNAGPVVVTFVDSKGKNDNKRVTADVTGVMIADRKGGNKVYTIDSIPPAVRNGLVAFALASRAKTYVVNNIDDDHGNVIPLADKVYSDFAAGKLYSRGGGEGGAKPGRKFDPTDWVEAVRMSVERQAKSKKLLKNGKPVQEMTATQVEDLKQKLIAMTPKDRLELINGKFRQNGLIAACYASIQAKKLADAAKKETDTQDISELF